MTVATVAQNVVPLPDQQHMELDQTESTYKLKSVVKDTRVQPALHAQYCYIKTALSCSNLLLVLTSNTLTIYDDFHMGDHVAIVAQYVHEDTEEQTTMVSATWMPGAATSEIHSGSPRILLALSNGSLAVVDIVESQITQMFDAGFDASGYLLLAAPESWEDGKEHVCVLGGNSEASVWNVAKEERVGVIEKAVSAVTYVGSGKCIELIAAFEAGAGGGVGRYDVDGKALEPTSATAVLDGEEVDSILPVGEGSCVLRSEREFRLWDMKEGAIKSTFKLKEKRDQSEVAFDSNGTVAVLGTEDGDGLIFDVQTGDELGEISVVRVSSEVEAVAVSSDGRHIVILAGSGFLFRFRKS